MCACDNWICPHNEEKIKHLPGVVKGIAFLKERVEQMRQYWQDAEKSLAAEKDRANRAEGALALSQKLHAEADKERERWEILSRRAYSDGRRDMDGVYKEKIEAAEERARSWESSFNRVQGLLAEESERARKAEDERDRARANYQSEDTDHRKSLAKIEDLHAKVASLTEKLAVAESLIERSLKQTACSELWKQLGDERAQHFADALRTIRAILTTPRSPSTVKVAHRNVAEYDGAFKCLDCQATWGAITKKGDPEHCPSPVADPKEAEL